MKYVEVKLSLPSDHVPVLLSELAYGAALDQFGRDVPFVLVEKVQFKALSEHSWLATIFARFRCRTYRVAFAGGKFQVEEVE